MKAHRARKAQPFPKAAHVGERRAVQSVIGTQHATLAVQAHVVAEPDGTLGKINSAKRGAPSTIVDQREARQVLAWEQQWEASTLATLDAERATLDPKGWQIETDEAAPICHVAEPVSADTDGEWVIRWLLALMVLCSDPPAKALTTAASAPNRPQSDIDDVLRIAG